MTLMVQTTHASVELSQALLSTARWIYRAIIDNRQRQADLRVANHIRELPDQFLERFGVSRVDIERLSNLSNKRAENDLARAQNAGSNRKKESW